MEEPSLLDWWHLKKPITFYSFQIRVRNTDVNPSIRFLSSNWARALEYDVGDQVVRGYDTIQSSSEELASHTLVFALVEVKCGWKEVVAYHLTRSNLCSKAVVEVLKEIIYTSQKYSFKITHITSDMGPKLKNALKIVTLTQLLYRKKGASYEDANSTFLVSLQESKNLEEHDDDEFREENEFILINLLDMAERNSLHYLVLYCLRKTFQNHSPC
ncbi:unnamed protein product [Lepeophtheirus salmonis]|uniref:(salmon louse) hypothetical protein n=1 Tax=Lepeophtheirus salmonis TaxID=72036 RepID=A0A7R8D2M7_LEPSM|nr:unnamed protein product [Lepeophtheirus salmonis]CAF2977744.1 unnamed protein product [Lepeophtheirus salmonis]